MRLNLVLPSFFTRKLSRYLKIFSTLLGHTFYLIKSNFGVCHTVRFHYFFKEESEVRGTKFMCSNHHTIFNFSKVPWLIYERFFIFYIYIVLDISELTHSRNNPYMCPRPYVIANNFVYRHKPITKKFKSAISLS